MLQPMLDAAKLLNVARPTKFFLPIADGVDELSLRQKISDAQVEITLVNAANRYDLMSISDAAMATSGTVVLEAALLKLPCVVLYKMTPLNYLIGKLLVDIKFFSLPNILAGDGVLTELLQDAVTPENICAEVLKLYRGEENRTRVVAKLKLACDKLGSPGSASRVAKKILAVAGGDNV